jgi:hypothetical protein
MGVNKEREHVFVLPEDRADEQLATEFQARIPFSQRQMYILGVAGGWTRVLDEFKAVHVAEMTLNPLRFMVLLIDFDEDHNRLAKAKSVIPDSLTDRVFVLGAWTKPENLKATLGSYPKIGSDLVEDCRDGTDKTWGTPLLKHNAGELDRLRQHVRSLFF